MIDPKAVRDDPQAFDAGLARRGLGSMSERILELDSRRREVQTAMAEAGELIAEVARLKERLQAVEEEERTHTRALDELLAGIPNLPAADVPEGADESANVVIRTVGEKPRFDFEPKEHFELGAALGMDFERAAKLSGARFVVLAGGLARLERALAAFMLDLHTGEFGYTEVSPPLLVRDQAAFGTGNLPKFANDLFHTTDGLDGFWLIPTAEMSLTNLVAGDILDEASLPLRFTAYTACFRSEAGARTRSTSA
jgi:seryl-tRNA synthetase